MSVSFVLFLSAMTMHVQIEPAASSRDPEMEKTRGIELQLYTAATVHISGDEEKMCCCYMALRLSDCYTQHNVGKLTNIAKQSGLQGLRRSQSSGMSVIHTNLYQGNCHFLRIIVFNTLLLVCMSGLEHKIRASMFVFALLNICMCFDSQQSTNSYGSDC